MVKKKTENEADAGGQGEVINPLETTTEVGDMVPATVSDPEAGSQVPATRTESAPLERSDFITPKLNLVQRTGDMSVQFTQGSWVLNKEIQITKAPEDPLEVIVLERPFKFFMEHLPYDPNGPKSRTFNTIEELDEAGLTLDWDNKNNIRATADRAARVFLLILKPKETDAVKGFGLEVDGLGDCTVATWLLVNTSYTTAARRIFTAEKLDLADKPIHSLVWTLRSVSAKIGGYNIFVPQLTPSRSLPDETQGSLKTMFSLA